MLLGGIYGFWGKMVLLSLADLLKNFFPWSGWEIWHAKNSSFPYQCVHHFFLIEASTTKSTKYTKSKILSDTLS